MNHSTMLTHLLHLALGLHRARLACLAALIIARFKGNTVKRAGPAAALPGADEIDSIDRRRPRLVKDGPRQPARMAPCVLAFRPDAPSPLALDRTPWRPGRTPIHVLGLAVVPDGIALPRCGRRLTKQGTSNPQERIDWRGQVLTGG